MDVLIDMAELLKKLKKVLAFFKTLYYYMQVLLRQQRWLIGQAVKTPPSHGGNRGSIPLSAVLLNSINLTEILENYFKNFFYNSSARARNVRYHACMNQLTFCAMS